MFNNITLVRPLRGRFQQGMYAIRRCRFATPSVTQSGTVPPSYKFHGPIIVNSQLSIGSLFQSVKERRPFPFGGPAEFPRRRRRPAGDIYRIGLAYVLQLYVLRTFSPREDVDSRVDVAFRTIGGLTRYLRDFRLARTAYARDI